MNLNEKIICTGRAPNHRCHVATVQFQCPSLAFANPLLCAALFLYPTDGMLAKKKTLKVVCFFVALLCAGKCVCLFVLRH